MTCAQVLPTRFALRSHTKTADKVCTRWSRGGDLTENSMRPVALGRRNWIRIGSAQILAHRNFQPTAAF
jgi:hypothetical protein